ncbi:acyl transferase [Chryseolinea sp. T2]|uniref:acyl transferase n=1 Tax=Chryseolinea sp. T2 TaxID=3129255 RepID=UPI0030773110
METFKSFESQIYSVNAHSFTDIALRIFRFQAQNNPVYKSFLGHLRTDISRIGTVEEIPFMPISFFKDYTIKTGDWIPEVVFTSSGTTGNSASRHHVASLGFYLQNARRTFEYFFGPLTNYHFLALLPSYLEREGSSLISMMDYFIRESHSHVSGFYLYDVEKLKRDLSEINDGRTIILWGVSFALLDFAEQHPMKLGAMLFETGGMKGRRKELTREELHQTLTRAFDVEVVHSEYGMTELLSQAYTRGGAKFIPPPWMRIIGRDLTDPLTKGLQNETVGINVVDLANLHSIAFIETQDLGKVFGDGTFEILGRTDNSDVRGCNLLVN